MSNWFRRLFGGKKTAKEMEANRAEPMEMPINIEPKSEDSTMKDQGQAPQ